MNQQITTIETLWSWLKNGGIYCCEDIHTSYMNLYKDLGNRTFIDYINEIINILHLNYYKKYTLNNTKIYFETMNRITISNSIICINKEIVEKWERVESGTFKIPIGKIINN